jgi:hypothetical protein
MVLFHVGVKIHELSSFMFVSDGNPILESMVLFTNSDVLTTELVKSSGNNTEVLTTGLSKPSGLPQMF